MNQLEQQRKVSIMKWNDNLTSHNGCSSKGRSQQSQKQPGKLFAEVESEYAQK
ncbi:hypothetical protein L195_g023874, partial [Trifolium pratense]